jgi:hypothetical protein
VETLVSIIVWIVKVLRFVPKGKEIVVAVKSRASLQLSLVLHEQAIHRMRNFSSAVANQCWFDGGQSAIEVCTAYRELMGNLLGLSPDQLHCCLKGFLPEKCTGAIDSVVTVARSEPLGNRPIDLNNYDAHPVSENTVWASLMGRNDGARRWRALKCFHCGDLYGHGNNFKCTRKEWQDYYRSTLVFPIRYMVNLNSRSCEITGFLAFDSLMKNAFGNLPDAFQYLENDVEYHTLLWKNTQFHLGAILADTLSVFLKPMCQ